MASNWTHDPRDTCGVLVTGSDEFTVTNYTQDLTLDCTAIQISGAAVVCANVLGTLINILKNKGIISGSVS